MTVRFPAGILSAVFLMICTSGCYNRWTGNYSDLAELDDVNAPIVETTGMSEEDQQKRIAFLESIARSKIPVYTINGGDKIEIKVYNHPDLSVKTVVTPDGFIGMVLVGEINVAGLTLAQASQKIAEALSKYIRNPKVGLSPYEIVSETATISGAISSSGIYTITDGMRLADLFAKAGGAAARNFDGQTLSAADYTHSVFIRDNQIIPLDFVEAIEHGNPLHNILLHRGDYIFIAARENTQVYLIGEVKKPGRHIWNTHLGLLELIAEGGGMNEIHWSNVIIIRGGLTNPKMYKVDLDAILRGDRPNVALKSGDIVYVPKDNISEYNVFIRKLFPTAQLINMMITPSAWMTGTFL